MLSKHLNKDSYMHKCLTQTEDYQVGAFVRENLLKFFNFNELHTFLFINKGFYKSAEKEFNKLVIEKLETSKKGFPNLIEASNKNIFLFFKIYCELEFSKKEKLSDIEKELFYRILFKKVNEEAKPESVLVFGAFGKNNQKYMNKNFKFIFNAFNYLNLSMVKNILIQGERKPGRYLISKSDIGMYNEVLLYEIPNLIIRGNKTMLSNIIFNLEFNGIETSIASDFGDLLNISNVQNLVLSNWEPYMAH